MPEITENLIRIPNPKHTESGCQRIRTMNLSASEGISALYCLDHKKIKTYLFDRSMWTMAKAKKWVEDHNKNFKEKDFKMLILKGQIEKATEEQDGLLDVSVASTSVVDRDGEVINQDGWDLKNFKKNPQLLWSHNIREVRPPIGKVTKIWFEGTGKSKVMKFKALFDMADEFAKEIYRKIKDGFLSAFSVGFVPLEREGSTYTKVELLEISVVPIPSNPQALVELRSKGMNTMTWKEVAEGEEEKTEEPSGSDEKVDGEKTEDSDIQPVAESPAEPIVDGGKTEEEPKSEENEEKLEDLKTLVIDTLREIRQEKQDKDLEVLRDSLRIVYQAVAIALKNLKEVKK